MNNMGHTPQMRFACMQMGPKQAALVSLGKFLAWLLRHCNSRRGDSRRVSSNKETETGAVVQADSGRPSKAVPADGAPRTVSTEWPSLGGSACPFLACFIDSDNIVMSLPYAKTRFWAIWQAGCVCWLAKTACLPLSHPLYIMAEAGLGWHLSMGAVCRRSRPPGPESRNAASVATHPAATRGNQSAWNGSAKDETGEPSAWYMLSMHGARSGTASGPLSSSYEVLFTCSWQPKLQRGLR